MNGGLTIRAANEYDSIRSGRMTPEMAAEYLKGGQIVLRSFSDTLREMYQAADIQKQLAEEFIDHAGINPDSVNRKVRNWLSGQNIPTSREDIFHIAFALGLSESQADSLLGMCTDCGIHYREGRDVIYAWFLRTGRSYGEAKAFFETLPPVLCMKETPMTENDLHLTRELQAAFQRISSLEELRTCYAANLNRFGTLHLRAYAYFTKYMDQLIRPSSDWDGREETDYSIEAVMERYFSMHMPPGRNRSGYSAVQKLIRHNWPNATALKNIQNRQMDVPRKLLLLLYVVTENVIDGSYQELDEEYITLQERLDEHWWILNAILTDCGMPTLDPRNPTDWLVLYSLTAGEESMSERMEQVIDKIYNE